MSLEKDTSVISSQQNQSKFCKHCGTTENLAANRFECKPCRASVEKARYYSNRDKLLSQKREAYEKEADKFKERNRIQYRKHIDKRHAYASERRNLPEDKLRVKEYNQKYKPIRRAFENNARVSFDKPEEATINLWKMCKFLQSLTNTVYEVDHVIPLKNDKVCGLHCLDNIQVLTLEQNRSKGNSFYV